VAEPSDDHQRREVVAALDAISRALEHVLAILLGIGAVAILAGAIFIMLKMDAGSRSQGGRFYVALGALVALGAVESQFARLVRRRAPLSLTTTGAERRYILLSLVLMIVSAVVLIGVALLLP
jgi:hypothetical protein